MVQAARAAKAKAAQAAHGEQTAKPQMLQAKALERKLQQKELVDAHKEAQEAAAAKL